MSWYAWKCIEIYCQISPFMAIFAIIAIIIGSFYVFYLYRFKRIS